MCLNFLQRAVVNISREAEHNISQILHDVRRQSDASQTGMTSVGSSASMASACSSQLAATLSDSASLSSMDVVDSASGDVRMYTTATTDLDERLKEELLETQRSNRTYQKMMVGSLFHTHTRTHTSKNFSVLCSLCI